MGKVNGLWMDQNLDLEQYDVTGESVMEAMAEAATYTVEATAAGSKHHRFDDTMTFCEKCGKSMESFKDELIVSYIPATCTGTPKAGPMVRVMKVRTR